MTLKFYKKSNGFYHTKSRTYSWTDIVINPAGMMKGWKYENNPVYGHIEINGENLIFISAKKNQSKGWLYLCQLKKDAFKKIVGEVKKKTPISFSKMPVAEVITGPELKNPKPKLKEKVWQHHEINYSRTEIAKSLGVSSGVLYSVTYGMPIPWEEDHNYQYWLSEADYKKWFPVIKQKIAQYKKDRAKSSKTRAKLQKNPRYHLDKQKAYAAQGMRYKLPDWVIEWQKQQEG